VAYTVVKTIKGKQYLYLQNSWREGKKVKTKATCLGRVGGSGRKRRVDEYEQSRRTAQNEYDREMARLAKEDKLFSEWQKKTFGETGEERAARMTEEARGSQPKAESPEPEEKE